MIRELQNDDGEWIRDDEGMRRLVCDHFQKVFAEDDCECFPVLNCLKRVVSDADNIALLKPFTLEEFSEAVSQMHPDKAPGPDGLNPAFFQKLWGLIGTEVVKSCQVWLDEGTLPAEMFETLIVLIPKSEGLSALFRKAEERGEIHGCRASQKGPRVSHLFFADDSFFFFQANEQECTNVNNLLNIYEKASGQSVNLRKSGVFFSNNVSEEKRAILSDVLGVTNSLDHSKYLGLPSMIGRNKKAVFAYLKDKLWQRIRSWKNRFLTRAGKEIMLKSVCQAIPSYCMSVFQLPSTLCEELQRIMNSFWWGSGTEGKGGVKWLAWDRMCSSKSQGGMGFRNLKSFNLAMLGKQGWRLGMESNTLLFRVFKAKYFPQGDFWSAPVGNNPSFSWRSIHASQELLNKGLRWRIGNGEKVRTFVDPWLPKDDRFVVEKVPINVPSDLLVSSLMVEGGREWDHTKLQEHCSAEDAQVIEKIPIPWFVREDRRIWHFDKKGFFSVKTAYFLAEKNRSVVADMESDDVWRIAWSMDVQPKIKDFVWRTLRGVIPTRACLEKRGMLVATNCARCGAEEDVMHAIVNCPFAADTWKLWNLHHTMAGSSFSEIIKKLDASYTKVDIAIFCVLAWNIWNARNKMLWQKIHEPAGVVYQNAIKTHEDWVKAKAVVHVVNQTNVIGDVKEYNHDVANGWLGKCDAAIFKEEQRYGFGAIFTRADGTFVAAISGHFHGITEPQVAEALALRSAVNWANSNMTGKGIIVSDAKLLVQAVGNDQSDESELGVIYKDVQVLIKQRQDFSLHWVRRQANLEAHALARSSNLYASFKLWEAIPTCVMPFLN